MEKNETHKAKRRRGGRYRNPLTRQDVRLGDWVVAGDKLRVTAFPIDAVDDEGKLPDDLWQPLMAELTAEAKRRRRRKWKLWSRAFDGPMPKGKGYVVGSDSVKLSRSLKPYADYDPRHPVELLNKLKRHPCAQCARRFYGNAFSRYCSDRCADAATAERRREWTEERSTYRAIFRDDYCSRCGTEMTSSRSTKRYCSPKCRAAAHRKATRKRHLTPGKREATFLR